MASPNSKPVHVAIIGHSFVRRARTFLLNRSRKSLNLDLSFGTHVVTFNGVGGSKIQDVANLFQQVEGLDPHIVVIDLGTNDLCSSTNPVRLALALYEQAKFILAQDSVRRVILLQVCPRVCANRARERLVSDNISAFNDALHSLCKDGGDSISYRFTKALASNLDNVSRDGCHLNTQGMLQYVKSLRRAILRFSGKSL